MIAERSTEELIDIADELMRALPCGVSTLTPALEQRFTEIVGPLSKEDLARLGSVFLLRHELGCKADYIKKVLAS